MGLCGDRNLEARLIVHQEAEQVNQQRRMRRCSPVHQASSKGSFAHPPLDVEVRCYVALFTSVYSLKALLNTE